jgi:hypothetical protein
VGIFSPPVTFKKKREERGEGSGQRGGRLVMARRFQASLANLCTGDGASVPCFCYGSFLVVDIVSLRFPSIVRVVDVVHHFHALYRENLKITNRLSPCPPPPLAIVALESPPRVPGHPDAEAGGATVCSRLRRGA